MWDSLDGECDSYCVGFLHRIKCFFWLKNSNIKPYKYNRHLSVTFFMHLPGFDNACHLRVCVIKCRLCATFTLHNTTYRGWDSSVGIATGYGLDGPGIEFRHFRILPDPPWGPPILLYNAYRPFPGLKWPGRGVDHPPPSSPEVK
jgi:hypothetical protein